jgi:UDP-N-acetylglucosamine:LPS N-acetylglucosamine transferase
MARRRDQGALPCARPTCRVLAVSSGGGHWVQLQRLRPAFQHADMAYVTVADHYRHDLDSERFYVVTDFTRRSLPRLVKVVPQLLAILLRERPDVVITTGAAPGLIALLLAKMTTRATTIWIDSIANCERMSSSGLQARRFADKWLTQWPNLARPDGPQYWGAVL